MLLALLGAALGAVHPSIRSMEALLVELGIVIPVALGLLKSQGAERRILKAGAALSLTAWLIANMLASGSAQYAAMSLIAVPFLLFLYLWHCVVIDYGAPKIRRQPAGVCTGCGYDLQGNVSGRCPECRKLTDDVDDERSP